MVATLNPILLCDWFGKTPIRLHLHQIYYGSLKSLISTFPKMKKIGKLFSNFEGINLLFTNNTV